MMIQVLFIKKGRDIASDISYSKRSFTSAKLKIIVISQSKDSISQ